MSRDCPKKKKPKCHNCGGPHTLDECDGAHWDTDRIFESKRQEKERFAKRHQPEEVRPVASITIRLTDLKGTAATIDTYDSVLDAVPEALSTTYISATEGFKLGYGGDIEAEGAEAKAKNAVMSMPTVKIITQRVGCSVLGCGAEPPQFWVLLIWLEPGISHVTWVHYDATMCLPCFVCSILPVLHFLRFDLCVL